MKLNSTLCCTRCTDKQYTSNDHPFTSLLSDQTTTWNGLVSSSMYLAIITQYLECWSAMLKVILKLNKTMTGLTFSIQADSTKQRRVSPLALMMCTLKSQSPRPTDQIWGVIRLVSCRPRLEYTLIKFLLLLSLVFTKARVVNYHI